MRGAKALLRSMSSWLDVGNRSVNVIRLNVTRRYAMRIGCKPEKRGGELKYAGRIVMTREIQ